MYTASVYTRWSVGVFIAATDFHENSISLLLDIPYRNPIRIIRPFKKHPRLSSLR